MGTRTPQPPPLLSFFLLPLFPDLSLQLRVARGLFASSLVHKLGDFGGIMYKERVEERHLITLGELCK